MEGLTEGKKCSVCDEILVPQQVIEAGSHVLVVYYDKPATCTEDGYVYQVRCAICDYIIYTEVIPALGHDYDNGSCVVCGKKESENNLS